MTEGDIAERLIEAYEIALRSYGSVGPKAMKSMSLPYLHGQVDKNGWGSERLAEERKEFWDGLARQPTARQISEADEALGWLALVSNANNRMNLSEWAYCHASGRRYFKDSCFKWGIHPETGRRRKDRAISEIVFKLFRKPLQNNNIADFGELPDDPEISYFADKIRDPRRLNGVISWADEEAFQPIISNAEHDFSWAEKRNEQRRQRRATALKRQAA